LVSAHSFHCLVIVSLVESDRGIRSSSYCHVGMVTSS
jgi:hypothetical protein